MTLKRVGIIGAGTMGNGIAQTVALAGIDVVLIDVSQAALASGFATMVTSLQRLTSKGILEPALSEAALARIERSMDYASLRDAELVIEAEIGRAHV